MRRTVYFENLICQWYYHRTKFCPCKWISSCKCIFPVHLIFVLSILICYIYVYHFKNSYHLFDTNYSNMTVENIHFFLDLYRFHTNKQVFFHLRPVLFLPFPMPIMRLYNLSHNFICLLKCVFCLFFLIILRYRYLL